MMEVEVKGTRETGKHKRNSWAGLISERRNCRGRKCTIVLYGVVYLQTSNPRKYGNINVGQT